MFILENKKVTRKSTSEGLHSTGIYSGPIIHTELFSTKMGV